MVHNPPSVSQLARDLALERCRLRVTEALRGKQRMHMELVTTIHHDSMYQHEIEAADNRIKMYDNDMVVPALVAYAQSECRELCDKIHSTFPREIRDGIYFYLCPPKVWFNNMPKSYLHAAYVPRGFDPLVGFEHEQPWQVSYVGNAFFREFMEQVYRTTEFFIDSENIQAVRSVTNDDLWASSLDPKEHLIHVTFSVFANEVADNNDAELGSVKDNVLAILHSFLDLKKTAKICIDFTTYKICQTRVSRIEALADAMDVLFPAIIELHTAGFSIRATLDYGKIKMHDNFGSLSLEEWKGMLGLLVVGGS